MLAGKHTPFDFFCLLDQRQPFNKQFATHTFEFFFLCPSLLASQLVNRYKRTHSPSATHTVNCFLVKITPEDIIECSRSESTKLFWYWKRTHINFFWKKLTIFCKNSIFFISTNSPRYWKAIYWIFLSWVYGKLVQIAYFNHFHNKVKVDSYDFFLERTCKNNLLLGTGRTCCRS